MADARHFCPECGNIELTVEDKLVAHVFIGDGSNRTKCPNCGWEGTLAETIGAVSSEQFWDLNRVANVLLRVVAKHAAGPFVQVLEFVGLMERPLDIEAFAQKINYELKGPAGLDEDLKARYRAHEAHVESSRNEVLRAMFTGAMSEGFAEAERQHRIYAAKMNLPLHQLLREEKEKAPS